MKMQMKDLWCLEGKWGFVPDKDAHVFTADEIDAAVADANARALPDDGNPCSDWSKRRLDKAMSAWGDTCGEAAKVYD